MKFAIRTITAVIILAGLVGLVRLSNSNRRLTDQVEQLEAELGRMPIDQPDRVHLVEIETPDVPPEIASHLIRVWQFRCYSPPGYDVVRFSGGGRVAEKGLYFSGGSTSGWGTPQAEAHHKLVTISFQKIEDRLEAFESFGGSSGTTSWGRFDPNHFDDSIVVQKLVSSKQGARSFDQQTILPLLKLYDPRSAEEKDVAGETLTTYSGGLFVLCPKARESDFSQLTRGETPEDFTSRWIATETEDE
ncbi:MAG: hypothetical protein R3C05_31135 [Pirellulaceae bacterium]